jgi:hypothetical protein
VCGTRIGSHMSALSILVIVLAAASLAIYGLHLRSEHQLPSETPEDHFVGGGTWSPGGGAARKASWPLVRLDIVPSGIMVGPTSRWLRWAVPQVVMQWSDILNVESRPTGVRINLKGDGDRALLFQMHRDAVLAALREHPIDLRP